MRCWLILSLLAAGRVAHAQDATLVPFFSVLEDGPTFVLHCVNTSKSPIIGDVGPDGLRVDGKILNREGGVISSFIGGVPTFAPGDTWRVIVPLSQSNSGRGGRSHGAGVNYRAGWQLPLRAGRHTVAMRCGGRWSNEIEFYWDDQR